MFGPIDFAGVTKTIVIKDCRTLPRLHKRVGEIQLGFPRNQQRYLLRSHSDMTDQYLESRSPDISDGTRHSRRVNIIYML